MPDYDYKLYTGDCLEILRRAPSNKCDSIVTDPPAGISFMNATWDSDKGSRNNWIAWLTEVMEECFRVTKPGGHAFVWALPRTAHWTAMALEDAGWDIRDSIHHTYGSGFPKKRNIYELDIKQKIEKQLKEQGVEGEIKWS